MDAKKIVDQMLMREASSFTDAPGGAVAWRNGREPLPHDTGRGALPRQSAEAPESFHSKFRSNLSNGDFKPEENNVVQKVLMDIFQMGASEVEELIREMALMFDDAEITNFDSEMVKAGLLNAADAMAERSGE